jgi:hypothetical protein
LIVSDGLVIIFMVYPVDVTANFCPGESKWNLGVRLHVCFKTMCDPQNNQKVPQPAFSKQKLTQPSSLISKALSGLTSGIPSTSTWSNLLSTNNIGQRIPGSEGNHSERIILGTISYTTVLDLGANDGYFSRLLAKTINR